MTLVGRLQSVTSEAEYSDGGTIGPLSYEVTVWGDGWSIEVRHVPAGTQLPRLGDPVRLRFSEDQRMVSVESV